MKPLIYCALLLTMVGCKEKFEANIESPVTGYLVIEGVVNSGPGPTTIQLTRSTPLDQRRINYERGAMVRVEGEDNRVYALAESAPGQYTAANLNLPGNIAYRLRINTAGGKEYISSFENVIYNPPIDSIEWVREADGIQMFIHTNNPQGNSRYYQWNFNETWEIRSTYMSNIQYRVDNSPNGERYSVDYRFPSRAYDTTIVKCWQSFNSNDILLGSSAKLSKDIIELPINFVNQGSIKLGVLYSIYVRQFAWSREGYQFLEKVKKNSQDIGSIFDAQPSQIKGNIRNVADSTEPVIGYFNVSNMQETRRFISAREVTGWNYRAPCETLEIKNISDTIRAYGLSLLPYEVGEFAGANRIATFFAATPTCIDCTLIGTNVKPPFWP